jgi:pSer/pThr/pTyr-binding forkhead associated (FHA) protein
MLADRDSRAAAVQITHDRARNNVAAACSADVPVCTPAADFTLVVTEGESFGKRLLIGNSPVVIGRGVGVDLQVMDPTVSRHHCVIWRAAGRCWVRDLGSTNRTRVNKRSSIITELFDGDVVVIGQSAVTISASRPESEHAREG